jgi:hypothetical protein
LWPGKEDVELKSGTDIDTNGLILEKSNSPGYVVIDGCGRTIELTGTPNGNPLITVRNGVTLALRNITLNGMKNNTAPLIRVEKDGTLILEAGAIIRNNVNISMDTTADRHGGGVVVADGTFTMNGGEIINNVTSSYVKTTVGTSGTFTMKGGRIFGNTVDGASSSGGGVGAGKGAVVLGGGTVSDTAEWTYGGGGVQVLNGGTFTMNSGRICGNKVEIFPKFVASAGTSASNFDLQKGSIAYSLDGETWTTINLPGTWWGLAYANDRFIALSTPKDSKDGQIAYSQDGVNWTAKHVEGGWWGAASGNNRYVAVGNGRVAYSTDGETWTPPESSANLYRRVVYGNGKFVAIARDKTPVAFSLTDNGKAWQPFGSISKGGTWVGLIYANNRFVTVSFGQTTMIAVDKNDGKGWTEFSYNGKLALGIWGGIAYGGGKFVVVSRAKKTAYSEDGGATWEDHKPQPVGAWDDVTYGNNRFVAVASDGFTVYSDDGINWSTPQSLPGQWRQVVYGNQTAVSK